MLAKHVNKVRECLSRRFSSCEEEAARPSRPSRPSSPPPVTEAAVAAPSTGRLPEEKWAISVDAALALLGGFLIQLTLGSYYRCFHNSFHCPFLLLWVLNIGAFTIIPFPLGSYYRCFHMYPAYFGFLNIGASTIIPFTLSSYYKRFHIYTSGTEICNNNCKSSSIVE